VLIDWFTVAAQAINFLILVGLLKFLLYNRVVAAMQRRKQSIASRLEEAHQVRRQAEEQIGEFRRKEAELERQRLQLLDAARQEADALRKELLDQARHEAERRQAHWQRTLQERQEHLVQELKRRAGEGLCQAVRRALQELADAELEQQLTAVFVRRLSRLDPPQRSELAAELRRAGGRLTVLSSWDLPEKRRTELVDDLCRVFDQELDVRFERSKELICGLELRAEGRSVSWNFDRFLDLISEDIGRELQEASSSAEPERHAREAGG
jgi:F-type H+-transporting ATPase subunit b